MAGRQKEWKNRVFWSVLTIRSLRRAAESVIHSDPTRRDDHCSRAHPGDVMAFTRRLQGPPPAIDHRGCEFGSSRPSRGVSPATGAFPATADAAAARLLDQTAASGCAQVGALSRTAFSRRHGKSDGRLFPRGRREPAAGAVGHSRAGDPGAGTLAEPQGARARNAWRYSLGVGWPPRARRDSLGRGPGARWLGRWSLGLAR